MPTIHIKDEQELIQAVTDLAHAGNNMRLAQKYWSEHGGGLARDKKKYWETKFDGVLNRLGLSEHQNLKAIKIVKDGQY